MVINFRKCDCGGKMVRVSIDDIPIKYDKNKEYLAHDIELWQCQKCRGRFVKNHDVVKTLDAFITSITHTNTINVSDIPDIEDNYMEEFHKMKTDKNLRLKDYLHD